MDQWYLESIMRHILAMKKEYWWKLVLEDTNACIRLDCPWCFDADLVDEALSDMCMDNLLTRSINMTVEERFSECKRMIQRYIPDQYLSSCALSITYIYATNIIQVRLCHHE